DGGATDPVSTQPSPVVQPVRETPRPAFYGVRVKTDFERREVFKYLNELALFKNQWQLKTASATDYARLVEEKFRPILLELQEEIIREGWLQPRAVYGYFPCQSEANDVIIYAPEAATAKVVPREIQRISFPQQSEGRRLCIADFFAARASGR